MKKRKNNANVVVRNDWEDIDKDVKEILNLAVGIPVLQHISAIANAVKNNSSNPNYRPLSEKEKKEIMQQLGQDYQALFIGGYTQYFKQGGARAFAMPFLMMQKRVGKFEGDIGELGLISRFSGRLERGVSVEFDKQYEPSQLQSFKGKIHYLGEYHTKKGLYLGRWSFGVESPGDLQKSGRFFLREL